MAGLLRDHNAAKRESIIGAIAADTQTLLGPEMLRDGRLSFPRSQWRAERAETPSRAPVRVRPVRPSASEVFDQVFLYRRPPAAILI